MNKKKRKNREKREKRSREGENTREAKVWESRLLDHEFFGRGRLWFMLFHSKLLIANDMYWVIL